MTEKHQRKIFQRYLCTKPTRKENLFSLSQRFMRTLVFRTTKKTELYTACLPSEVKLKSQLSNLKDICYVDTLFMLPVSEKPNYNPYFIKTETAAINPQRVFQMSMQSLQNCSLVKIFSTVNILNCWTEKIIIAVQALA